MSTLPRHFQRFRNSRPALFAAYEALGAAAAEAGPLDPKSRELIKLAMAAATQGETAVRSHTHRARELGATIDEIEHTLVLGITTLGFPRMMAALQWAQDALGEPDSAEG